MALDITLMLTYLKLLVQYDTLKEEVYMSPYILPLRNAIFLYLQENELKSGRNSTLHFRSIL
jgi:hypothetical protein